VIIVKTQGGIVPPSFFRCDNHAGIAADLYGEEAWQPVALADFCAISNTKIPIIRLALTKKRLAGAYRNALISSTPASVIF
jgi:hypothetical protein